MKRFQASAFSYEDDTMSTNDPHASEQIVAYIADLVNDRARLSLEIKNMVEELFSPGDVIGHMGIRFMVASAGSCPVLIDDYGRVYLRVFMEKRPGKYSKTENRIFADEIADGDVKIIKRLKINERTST
jgi:hypothetical protein